LIDDKKSTIVNIEECTSSW